MAAGPVDYLIVGLGNPGRKYEGTRHNVGFMALDLFAEQAGTSIKRLKFQSLYGEAMVGDKRCLLFKPQIFMNKSGEAVRDAASFYRIPPERIVLVFDDVALPTGKIRVRRKGTDGGHNGLKNIFYHMRSNELPRVKIGVGAKPHPDYNLADWVLSGFEAQEVPLMRESLAHACDAVTTIVRGDIDQAMNRFNS